MPATKSASARNGARASSSPKPKLSVARVEEALLLIERLVGEHTDVFIKAGQEYRDRHRDGSSRPLNAQEIAQIATGMGVELARAKTQIEQAGLEHVDEPEPQEVLLAAGVATAPAFLRALMRLTALLELPNQEFMDAREDGPEGLDAAIDDAVKQYGEMDMEDMRDLAREALDRLSAATGVAPGKALEVVQKTVTQGLGQALAHLTLSQPGSSLYAPSTDSPASTTGADGTSSTTSPGPRRRD